MKRSERLLDFVTLLRNGHVKQQHAHEEEGEWQSATVHAVTAESLSAVEAAIVSFFDLEEQHYL